MNPDPPDSLLRQGPQVRVYEARAQAVWDPSGWREMFAELIESRELTWRLFYRDFCARFRQNVGGVVWALVSPLVVVAAFMLLQSSGVLNVGQVQTPYPAYALLGLTIWQVFAGTVTGCTGALAQSGELVRRINFPREALVFSAGGHVVVDVSIRLVLTAAVFAWFGVVPCWTSIFLPLVLLPLFVLALGLGLVLSALNAVIRDVANLVALLTTYLVFLVPVMYPCPPSGILADVMRYNPLTLLVSAAQDVVLQGRLTQPAAFCSVAGGALLVALLCWRLFHIVEPRLAEAV